MSPKGNKKLREVLDERPNSTTEERRRWCDLYCIDNPRASLDGVREKMKATFGVAVGSDYIQASLNAARQIYEEQHAPVAHDLPRIGERAGLMIQAAHQQAVAGVLELLRGKFPVRAVVVDGAGSTRIEIAEESAAPPAG